MLPQGEVEFTYLKVQGRQLKVILAKLERSGSHPLKHDGTSESLSELVRPSHTGTHIDN